MLARRVHEYACFGSSVERLVQAADGRADVLQAAVDFDVSTRGAPAETLAGPVTRRLRAARDAVLCLAAAG